MIPLLVGAQSTPPMPDALADALGPWAILLWPIYMAVGSACGVGVAAFGRAALVFAIAVSRAIIRRWRTDKNPHNDPLADGLEAATDDAERRLNLPPPKDRE
jgi:hypothetical protein